MSDYVDVDGNVWDEEPDLHGCYDARYYTLKAGSIAYSLRIDDNGFMNDNKRRYALECIQMNGMRTRFVFQLSYRDSVCIGYAGTLVDILTYGSTFMKRDVCRLPDIVNRLWSAHND